MAFLEKNMIWLNTVITVAPMIGFTGTVVGMIAAFDAIKAANGAKAVIDALNTFQKRETVQVAGLEAIASGHDIHHAS